MEVGGFIKFCNILSQVRDSGGHGQQLSCTLHKIGWQGGVPCFAAERMNDIVRKCHFS